MPVASLLDPARVDAEAVRTVAVDRQLVESPRRDGWGRIVVEEPLPALPAVSATPTA